MDGLIDLSTGKVRLEQVNSSTDGEVPTEIKLQEYFQAIKEANEERERGNIDYRNSCYAAALAKYQTALGISLTILKNLETWGALKVVPGSLQSAKKLIVQCYLNTALCLISTCSRQNSDAYDAYFCCKDAIEIALAIAKEEPLLLSKARYRLVQAVIAIKQGRSIPGDSSQLENITKEAFVSLQNVMATLSPKLADKLNTEWQCATSVVGDSKIPSKSAGMTIDERVRQESNVQLKHFGGFKRRGLEARKKLSCGEVVFTDRALAYVNSTDDRFAVANKLLRDHRLTEVIDPQILVLASEICERLSIDGSGEYGLIWSLESHENKFKKENAAKYTALMSLSNELKSILSDKLDAMSLERSQIVSIILRMCWNTYPFHRPFDAPRGVGLYPVAALINHHASPNVCYISTKDGGKIVFRATRDISPGEELYFSYADPYLCSSETASVLSALQLGEVKDMSTRAPSCRFPQPEERARKRLSDTDVTLIDLISRYDEVVVRSQVSAGLSQQEARRKSGDIMKQLVQEVAALGNSFPSALVDPYLALEVCLRILAARETVSVTQSDKTGFTVASVRYGCASSATKIMEQMLPSRTSRLGTMYITLVECMLVLIQFPNLDETSIRKMKQGIQKGISAAHKILSSCYGTDCSEVEDKIQGLESLFEVVSKRVAQR